MEPSKGFDRKIEISNGTEFEEIEEAEEAFSTPLKSNLKKSSSMVEMRKVSWSDAHGKDIAHVQEFEPRYVCMYYYYC